MFDNYGQGLLIVLQIQFVRIPNRKLCKLSATLSFLHAYVLYSEKIWSFDQSESAQSPIYIIYSNKT